LLQSEKTMGTAAAKAGMDEKTAHKYRRLELSLFKVTGILIDARQPAILSGCGAEVAAGVRAKNVRPVSSIRGVFHCKPEILSSLACLKCGRNISRGLGLNCFIKEVQG